MKKWFVISLFIFIVLVATYIIYLYMNVQTTITALQLPIEEEQTPPPQPKLQDAKNLPPISILLLGIDHWASTGRTDTMIVITLNPESETVTMLSIPRDTDIKMKLQGELMVE